MTWNLNSRANVRLAHLVSFVQPSTRDRLNRPDRRDRPMNNAGGRNVVFFVRARGWMIIRRLLDVSIYRILLFALLSLCLLDLGPISHRELPSRFRSLSRVDFLHMWQSNCESDSLRTDLSSLPAYASLSAISLFLSVRFPNRLAYRGEGTDWSYAQPALFSYAVTVAKEEALGHV